MKGVLGGRENLSPKATSPHLISSNKNKDAGAVVPGRVKVDKISGKANATCAAEPGRIILPITKRVWVFVAFASKMRSCDRA
jgi:hypothetical protein